MTVLINALNREARRRGLLTGEHLMSEGVAFSLVRDMSYARASSRAPLTTIAEWKGTCSGKHYLLKGLFEELGMQVSLYAGLIYYSVDSCPWLPEHLLTFVAKEPLPDIHNFLRLETRPGIFKLVDATFPASVRSQGLVVNDFEPTVEMMTILPVEKEFEISDSDSPQDFKNTLINKYCGRFVEEREQFIDLLSDWVASVADSKSLKL